MGEIEVSDTVVSDLDLDLNYRVLKCLSIKFMHMIWAQVRVYI